MLFRALTSRGYAFFTPETGTIVFEKGFLDTSKFEEKKRKAMEARLAGDRNKNSLFRVCTEKEMIEEAAKEKRAAEGKAALLKIPGIEPKDVVLLEEFGIKTVGDLAKANTALLWRIMKGLGGSIASWQSKVDQAKSVVEGEGEERETPKQDPVTEQPKEEEHTEEGGGTTHKRKSKR